ncbi:hypothetical protein QTH97_30110 [Variovorax sp. J22R24]|uniref:hypothetical protein n=1 Tax=Variovorax gracilis TaxID=3053502 RepID=UPI0025758E85|nr:hypothetical protein [Variovorax sp. J22R24]MDM0109227.1 hypothetical protein [Variovorax sp. J22R24]
MLRPLFLLLAVLLPIGLVYAFGVWILFALFALTAATLLISTRKARGAEETQGGMLTRYDSTRSASL